MASYLLQGFISRCPLFPLKEYEASLRKDFPNDGIMQSNLRHEPLMINVQQSLMLKERPVRPSSQGNKREWLVLS